MGIWLEQRCKMQVECNTPPTDASAAGAAAGLSSPNDFARFSLALVMARFANEARPAEVPNFSDKRNGIAERKQAETQQTPGHACGDIFEVKSNQVELDIHLTTHEDTRCAQDESFLTGCRAIDIVQEVEEFPDKQTRTCFEP